MKFNHTVTLMELLASIGISQAELARRAGVAATTAHLWVHGKQVPKFAPWEFIALCESLGVTPEALASAFQASFDSANKQKSAHSKAARA